MRITRSLGTAAVLALSASTLALAPSASATQSHVALSACHASDNHNGTGNVPSWAQHIPFAQEAFKGKDILCGDGKTWGAVHIELKHKVANWDVVMDCLWTVEHHGRVISTSGGKAVYQATYPGDKARVVTGANGVITAYPEKDSGSESSWNLCSDQP